MVRELHLGGSRNRIVLGLKVSLLIFLMLLLLLCAATGTSRKVANRQLKRFEMWRWRRMEEIRLTDRVEDEYILYRVKEDWEDQDVDVRIILRWIFRKWEGVVGTGWI